MRLRDCFERIYVINLPYKSDRRERLERHLQELGLAKPDDITWVRAISGDWCRPPTYFQAGGGAWGCLQSHTRIVQDAIMDHLENYLVLEDDAIFHRRSSELLDWFMKDLPSDWGQLYLGGQHIREPEPLEDKPFIFRCTNVNRTHAFALHNRAMLKFSQHIANAPDYIANGSWHVDHQLGTAHQRENWKTYAPAWWISGQSEGPSNISGNNNPQLWWHPSRFSRGLPFVHVEDSLDSAGMDAVRQFVHFGNNLKYDTLEDIGLDVCVDSDFALGEWLEMIAREAIEMGRLPGLQHPRIPTDRLNSYWAAGVHRYREIADLGRLADYPYNGLFPHPLNQSPVGSIQGSTAA